MIKRLLKKILPKGFIDAYHLLLARLAQFYYRNPSSKMVVIGVTGTNGKSSTVQFIAQLLTAMGKKVGYTTTAGFNINGQEIENKMKMTMPGRFYLQSLLRDMVDEGCDYVIVETSSQGLVQYRHLGINYDVAVFTNLTPEHIESHGGFENYKAAKGMLFTHLEKGKVKSLNGERLEKKAIINGDDKHADYFAGLCSNVMRFGEDESNDLHWDDYSIENKGCTFNVQGIDFEVPLIGNFQHKNVLASIATLYGLGFSLLEISEVMQYLRPVPGRLQVIDQGQPFTVIVDYAYEPYALQALLDVADSLPHSRILGVHGSAGGGRDIARRPKIGALVAKREDMSVITNEDPYDEDPVKIINEVAEGAVNAGAKEGENLFLIEDRGEAIRFVLEQAQEGDVVLITGKGSEPVMAVANEKTIPWSDIKITCDILKELGYEETKN